jgi:hypothetical protein
LFYSSGVKEIGLSLAELGLLYLTRRKMTAELGKLVRRLGDGQREFVWLWSAIFLPGTLIHEVSHFLAAAVTGARTGRVEILPQLPRKTLGEDKTETAHRLGFVETQRLGPVRGFLVGTAPLVVGLGILVWISSTLKFSIFNFQFSILEILKIYLFFTVANSLFLSRADVKQALPLLVIAAILGGGLYFLEIRPEMVPDSRILIFLGSLWKAVAISTGVNLGAVIILFAANKILR